MNKFLKKSRKLNKPPNRGSNVITNPVPVLQTSCFPFIKNELVYRDINRCDK